MRQLLGAMREGDDLLELTPRPGLGRPADLGRETSGPRGSTYGSTWTAIRSQLPRSIDLSAYRIVQEGLTNALKHSGGAPGAM